MGERNLLSLSYGRIIRKGINQQGGLRPESYETYNVVEAGDVVLRMTDLQNDQKSIRTGQACERGIITSAYVTVRPDRKRTDPRFIASVLRAYDIQKAYYEMGAGVRQNLGYAELADIPIPLPELHLQKRIADHLDRETSEIDAMIAKMNDLADVLSARKFDAIQRETIRRGAAVSRLKFFARVSLGKTVQGSQKNDSERYVNYVRAASIQHHGLSLDDQRMWMSDSELARYDLRENDVLIVEGGAGYGRSVALADDMPEWGFQNHVIRVRPNSQIDGRFLDYCIKAHLSSGLIDVLVDGATIPALSSEKARELPIPDIAPEKQKRIADHLDEVTGRIDAMLAKVAELKTLLVERRAALITDVVTGRKKVA